MKLRGPLASSATHPLTAGNKASVPIKVEASQGLRWMRSSS